MDKIVISGGIPLCGEVQVSGAKNSALPILASTILGGGECVISNLPRVVDVVTMENSSASWARKCTTKATGRWSRRM